MLDSREVKISNDANEITIKRLMIKEENDNFSQKSYRKMLK